MDKGYWTIFKMILLIGLLLAFILHEAPYDNTDNKAKGIRSGMSLFTDHLTGCQYLRAGLFGGITPRLDYKGNHIGCKQ